MDIIIIGSGNIATVIGRKIFSAGYHIVQVYSRHHAHAEALAAVLQAQPIIDIGKMERKADMILLAISDNAYETVIRELPLTDAFLVHTAGSVPMDILKNAGKRYGVLYPLQSLRRELEKIPEFPLLIDANGPENLEVLKEMAERLSKTVIHANDEMRLKYHLGAVLVNNFINHLFALAENWCRREGIDFFLLQPLIQETVNRILLDSPADLQTGPAIRNDTQTLEKHRNLLKDYPELRSLYVLLTQSIRNFYHID